MYVPKYGGNSCTQVAIRMRSRNTSGGIRGPPFRGTTSLRRPLFPLEKTKNTRVEGPVRRDARSFGGKKSLREHLILLEETKSCPTGGPHIHSGAFDPSGCSRSGLSGGIMVVAKCSWVHQNHAFVPVFTTRLK